MAVWVGRLGCVTGIAPGSAAENQVLLSQMKKSRFLPRQVTIRELSRPNGQVFRRGVTTVDSYPFYMKKGEERPRQVNLE